MIRRTLLRAALLSLVVGLVPGAPAAGADPGFQALGCYTDVAGDAGGEPLADLVEVCANYDRGFTNMVVVLDTAGNQNPAADAGWANPETQQVVGFELDGDDAVDRVLRLHVDAGALVADLTDAVDGTSVCDPETAVVSGQVLARFARTCLDEASPIRMSAMAAYQATAGAAVAVDRLPDDGLTLPLPDDREEPPVCDNAQVDPGQLTIRRLACGGVIGGTEPISQAVATSQFVFDIPETPQIDAYTADYALIARDDDFADALAGSSLSFGQGPLLFTYSPASAAAKGQDAGRLADITRAELLRTLPRGRTVYLLGGTAALSAGLDQQLAEMGYHVVRFAGASREGTAAAIAREVDALVAEFSAATDFPDTNMVLIATRSNWPDAVVAGSVGAFWGMPILLVNATPPIHPETLAALDALRPDYIHVIGGTGVISNDAGRAIGDHARANGYALGRPGEDLSTQPWNSFCGGSFVCRWGGQNRIQTGGAVGQLNRDMVGRFGSMTPLVPENPQQYAAAVQLGNGGPNFAYALAAATVSGRFGGAVFIPTENQSLSPDIVNALCNTPNAVGFIEEVEEVVVVADTDVLSDSFTGQIRDLVEGGCPPPPG